MLTEQSGNAGVKYSVYTKCRFICKKNNYAIFSFTGYDARILCLHVDGQKHDFITKR